MVQMNRVFTRHNRASTLFGPEQLETRDMLSTSPLGTSLSSFSIPFSTTFDLHITGTEVRYDAFGLPAYMAGQISDAHDHSVGQYQETLTPILWNGQFIGTTGIGNFSFFLSAGSGPAPSWLNTAIGSITTADQSLIQGVTPAGQLLVHSIGTIIATTGVFQSLHLQGGF